ncbi:MAG: antibiotic biosynthesis monooxygenase [Burkholderia gladioli]
MYASTFIFRPGQYDAAFHRLDETIADIARGIAGYLGEEAWQSADGTLIQNVYYRESEAALKPLISHPAHIEAKRQQARWLDGYRVVIAQVLHQYGDGKLPMFANTSAEAAEPAASADGGNRAAAD